MNHNEILQAAKDVIGGDGIDEENNTVGPFLYFELERFAAIIEQRTIERCAAECDYVSKNARPSTVSYAYKTGADECAAAIRKLGEQ